MNMVARIVRVLQTAFGAYADSAIEGKVGDSRCRTASKTTPVDRRGAPSMYPGAASTLTALTLSCPGLCQVRRLAPDEG